MNDFEPDLENELRRLRPAAPSAGLATALDRQLSELPSQGWSPKIRLLLLTSWSLTAAAAAAAVIAWWPSDRPATAKLTVDSPAPVEEVLPERRIVPVAATNVLTDASDEGLVLLADGRPARRLRLRYVDTVQLRDDDARADIAVSRPREEVRFVPVDFY